MALPSTYMGDVFDQIVGGAVQSKKLDHHSVIMLREFFMTGALTFHKRSSDLSRQSATTEEFSEHMRELEIELDQYIDAALERFNKRS